MTTLKDLRSTVLDRVLADVSVTRSPVRRSLFFAQLEGLYPADPYPRTRAHTLDPAPTPTFATSEPGRPGPDGRARRFAAIEGWITGAERSLRRAVWDIPEADVPLRLVALENEARRRGLLADSARRAARRRVELARPQIVSRSAAPEPVACTDPLCAMLLRAGLLRVR